MGISNWIAAAASYTAVPAMNKLTFHINKESLVVHCVEQCVAAMAKLWVVVN